MNGRYQVFWLVSILLLGLLAPTIGAAQSFEPASSKVKRTTLSLVPSESHAEATITTSMGPLVARVELIEGTLILDPRNLERSEVTVVGKLDASAQNPNPASALPLSEPVTFTSTSIRRVQGKAYRVSGVSVWGPRSYRLTAPVQLIRLGIDKTVVNSDLVGNIELHPQLQFLKASGRLKSHLVFAGQR